METPQTSPASQTTAPIPRDAIRTDCFAVEVVGGPHTGAYAGSVDGIVTIGTGEDNALVLFDPTVSRHHAVLSGARGGVRVQDLGSTNGIEVEGCRVQDNVVVIGATVSLGCTKVRVIGPRAPISELRVGRNGDCPTADPYKAARAALLDQFEHRYFAKLLNETRGNVSAAARASGMNRTYLTKVLQRHGLTKKRG